MDIPIGAWTTDTGCMEKLHPCWLGVCIKAQHCLSLSNSVYPPIAQSASLPELNVKFLTITFLTVISICLSINQSIYLPIYLMKTGA